MKKKLLGMIFLIAALGLVAACSRPTEAPDVGDNPYIEVVDGYIDWISAEVVIEGGRIVDVIVDFNDETQSFVNMMHPSVVNHIIEHQTTAGINTRNGATVTTDALILAVNTILNRVNFVMDAEPDIPVVESTAGIVEQVRPGTYTVDVYGWARGGQATITVEVTFDGNEIVNITPDFNEETPGFVSMMHPSIVDAIVATQNTSNIDTANGATVTSESVIEAVNLIVAHAGVTLTARDGAPADVNGDDPDENGDEEPAAPAATTEAPAAGGATEAPAAAAGRFNPGAHRGTSNNTYSHRPDNEGDLSPTPLVVEVTVDDNNILSVTVVSHGETQAFVNMAGGVLTAIVSNQGTAGVTATAGATYTALAIIEAAGIAINAATR